MKNQRIRNWITQRSRTRLAILDKKGDPGFFTRKIITFHSLAADPAVKFNSQFPGIYQRISQLGYYKNRKDLLQKHINNMAYFYVGIALTALIHDSCITTIPYFIFSLYITDAGKIYSINFILTIIYV